VETTRKKRKSLMSILEPYLFVLPACACFAMFMFYPFFKTIYLSLYTTNKLGQARIFKGLGNYTKLFTSSIFHTVLINTFILALIVIVFSLLIGFLIANLANVKGRAFKIFTYFYSLPLAVSSASMALVFKKMLAPATGLASRLLGININFFTDPKYALATIGVLTVWLNLGINFIFINAGLQNVPADLYESAEIDGANGFKKMTAITIPSISPILFFMLIMDIISAFQSFAQVNVITEGGPGDATNVMVYNIYRDAFFNFKFGYAAAQSVILFLIILLITLIQFKYEKKMVNY
jgi:sn-glycerol 3-phosphate transport system permease protein